MEDKKIKSFDNTTLIYRIHKGENPKKAVVLLHGMMGSISAFYEIFDFFRSKGYTILMIDQRGHGLSEKPTRFEDYKIEFFAKDLKVVLDEEKIEKIDLIGHCLGGMVSINFTNLYPKMVDKLILISTNHYPRKGLKMRNMILLNMVPFYKFIKMIIPKKYKQKKGGRVDYSNMKKFNDWNLKRIDADYKCTSINTIVFVTKNIMNFDGRKIIKKIKVPTLIIHGEKDTLYPATIAKEMHKKIKGSKLMVIPQGNHVNQVLIRNPPILKPIYEFISD